MKFLYTNTKLLLFLLVLSTIANAQQVVYKPVFVSHCEDSPFVFFFVFSRDSTTIGNKIFDGIDSVVLPKSGSYWLLYKPNEEVIPIEIKNSSHVTDTFNLPRIELVSYVSNPPFSEYLDCDSPANGFITDYFHNGNIRLSGRFIKGQIIDTLKEFYYSGGLKTMFIILKSEIKRFEYYKNGNIKEEWNTLEKTNKIFYENGKIQKVEYFGQKSYNIISKEYYPDGELKKENKLKSRKSYKDGCLIERVTRKLIRKDKSVPDPSLWKLYDYKWSSWGTNSNNKRNIRFIDYGKFPDSINGIDSFSICKIKFYYKNKLYKKIIPKIEGRNLQKYIVYKRKEGKWIEGETISESDIYQHLNY